LEDRHKRVKNRGGFYTWGKKVFGANKGVQAQKLLRGEPRGKRRGKDTVEGTEEVHPTLGELSTGTSHRGGKYFVGLSGKRGGAKTEEGMGQELHLIARRSLEQKKGTHPRGKGNKGRGPDLGPEKTATWEGHAHGMWKTNNKGAKKKGEFVTGKSMGGVRRWGRFGSR